MANRFFPNYEEYKITSRFGKRTMYGVTRQHNGIDLVAKTSAGNSMTDYITAHTGGIVDDVGYNSSAGNYVVIKVATDVYMVYYHMANRCILKTGATVKKGDTLGYMGSTGNSTGAHLHFGIQQNGQWIDPEPYLDKDFPVHSLRNPYTLKMESLRRGCKGEDVRALQYLLICRGYSCGDCGADASFGADTEKAVKAFQSDCEIEVDGSVGPNTMGRLLGRI